MTTNPTPDPLLQRRLEEIAWIQANLKPGERLEDFLPPPSEPLPPLFGTRKIKRWPMWANVLAMAAAVALWPLVAMAGSAALAALLIGLPFWCVFVGWRDRNKPRPQTWSPPRVIPPYRPTRGMDRRTADNKAP